MNKQMSPYKESNTGMLSELDVQKLCFPFQPYEHEFNQGMVYIREPAINNRIDKIDRDWNFMPIEFYINGNSVVCRAQMMVKGVVRGNAGAGTFLSSDKPHVLADNVGNAYKGAATDALKRCARLFGVGRYLLMAAPKSGPAFDAWIMKKIAEAKVTYAAAQTEALEEEDEGQE